MYEDMYILVLILGDECRFNLVFEDKSGSVTVLINNCDWDLSTDTSPFSYCRYIYFPNAASSPTRVGKKKVLDKNANPDHIRKELWFMPWLASVAGKRNPHALPSFHFSSRSHSSYNTRGLTLKAFRFHFLAIFSVSTYMPSLGNGISAPGVVWPG